ncbi:MAG: undecaprenyldiphospho-muramoylpentapeptide beta-N-acetylglucosaminyltransferase [Myxococcales bacterium]|nr:undecaprenyldiphospho-muramoylpentapeptide beta-N-acetylglucosaminyltransferase [Myxococcales bacterium]
MILRGDKRPAPGAPPRLMIVGGGTGGHVFPGVAVAQAWLARVPSGEVVFVGSPRGMEARAVPALGIPFVALDARRLKNAGLVERLRALFSLPAALYRGWRTVRAHDPLAVLGVGGYVSGPVVLAAALAGRPCAIAEQNARPGLTNRLLARVVQRIFTAFPEAQDTLPEAKIRMLGNPVRQDFVARAAAAEATHATRTEATRILILGGSQGARALNEKLPPALARLAATHQLTIRHQTGQGKDTPVREAYAAAGLTQARVEPFIDDMVTAIVDADLIIARAGATTVAELAAIGRPALFIPFPHAADDHQAANAASLVDAGAALMAREETLTEDRLVDLIGALLGDPDRLAAMARSARTRGRPEAAAAIVDALLELAGQPAPAPVRIQEAP